MIAKGDQAQLSVLGAIHGEPKMNHRNTGGPSKLYQIKVKGHLDCDWSDWFEGLEIIPEEEGFTLICGPIPDQATLYAILKRVHNLGLPLISFNQVKTKVSDIHTKGERIK